MARSAVVNFMKQQGFTPEPPDRAALRFRGLQFQPTIVGSMMLVGILTQSPAIFLLFSALLWLNVLLPAANPFENLYNRFVARPRGRPLLTKAPGLIAVAFAALLFGRFCLGAYVYHLLKGNVAFANGTCPWSDSA